MLIRRFLLSLALAVAFLAMPATCSAGLSTDQLLAEIGKPVFRIYPTQNMWTLLVLDSAAGRVWQISYSVGGTSSRSVYPINTEGLLPFDDTHVVPDRFVLAETQNIWTFILLDQYTGATWQVQYGLDAEHRGIWTIPDRSEM